MKESDIVTQTAAHLDDARTQVNNYGSVPVFYAPKRKWLRKLPEPGLSHFIEKASTVAEVNKLLKKGREEFKNASKKTLRRWENAANLRIEQLKEEKKK